MIRILRPTDSTRLLFFRPADGGTQAFTLDSAAHPSACSFSAVRYIARAMAWRATRDGWISSGPSGIAGVVRVARRSAPTVWELSELYLGPGASPGVEGADMLAGIAAAGARRGAERVFLRLAEDGLMCAAARRAGYRLQTRETLYRRPRDLRGFAQATRDPSESGWRDVSSADLPSLFRFYSETTPLAVRTTAGMTMKEWRDALEPYRGLREMVLERGGAPAAWLRYTDSGKERLFALVARAGAFDDLGEVVQGVLAGGYGMPASVLIPAYGAGIGAALEDAGFVPGPTFELYVRVTALRAEAAQPAVVAIGG